MTTLSRRAWLQALLAGAPALAFAQKAPAGTDRDFNSGTIPDYTQLGTEPATPEEIRIANAILDGAPRSTPVEVFGYIEKRTERNLDGESYVGGWAKRWNPLIVRFFKQTKTEPSGDTTPWCAASLNWTLARCGLRGTGSASSSSFRTAPGKTDTPRPGDIVVFESADSREAAVGHGHVGILVERTPTYVVLIGGNQTGTVGHHAVCKQTIKLNGVGLKLHSYHSIAAFAPPKPTPAGP